MRVHGLISACLILCGCASAPIVRTETVTVEVPVYRACPIRAVAEPPLPDELTNGALLDWAIQLRAALRSINQESAP